MSTQELSERYARFQEENPKVRIRDAAKSLGVSEVELLVLGENVTSIGDFEAVLQTVPTLGRVMALTRNEAAVNERKGVYTDAEFHGGMGLVTNPDIDLRLFMKHWKYGFAVQQGERRSLQFFAPDGEAVHKIFLTDQSDVAAYDALVAKFTVPAPELEIIPYPAPQLSRKNVDIEAFQEGWKKLEDSHHFAGLLRKFGFNRREALTHAPEGYTKQIPLESIKTLLTSAAAQKMDIMVFVGSRGCVQIHNGIVSNIVEIPGWLNIIDPDFNLHVNLELLDEAWWVLKPTKNGPINAVEVYDKAGEIVLQFFGKRKPKMGENPEWTKLAQELAGK